MLSHKEAQKEQKAFYFLFFLCLFVAILFKHCQFISGYGEVEYSILCSIDFIYRSDGYI
jgi:hypothetical protein